MKQQPSKGANVTGSETPDFSHVQSSELPDMLERISDGFFAVDQEWRITYVNRRVEAILSIKRDDYLNQNLWECYPTLRGTVFEEQFYKASHLKVTVSFEWFSPIYQRSFEITVYPSPTGLSVFLRDITERKLLEQELEEQHNRSTAAILQAQEQERSQIGRELHDNVNQVLTTIKLYQELILSGVREREELAKKSLQLLQRSIDEIRNISRWLSAPTLGKMSLKDSVKDLLDTIRSTNKFTIEEDTTKIEGLVMSEELRLGVYRILQEKLTNIMKYAEATLVQVSFAVSDHYLTLIICDNGKGFDPEQTGAGTGIANMKMRAESLGGTLTIDAASGKGCKLIARFPFQL